MIEKLHLGWLRGEVLHLIMNHQAIGSGRRRISRREPQMRTEQADFFHLTDDANLERRIETHAELHEVGWQVGDSAMKS